LGARQEKQVVRGKCAGAGHVVCKAGTVLLRALGGEKVKQARNVLVQGIGSVKGIKMAGDAA
jgi:hypothetical protein